jgi:hypothetical protein
MLLPGPAARRQPSASRFVGNLGTIDGSTSHLTPDFGLESLLAAREIGLREFLDDPPPNHRGDPGAIFGGKSPQLTINVFRDRDRDAGVGVADTLGGEPADAAHRWPNRNCLASADRFEA